MTSPCDVPNFFRPANHAGFWSMLPSRPSKDNPDIAHIFRDLMSIRRQHRSDYSKVRERLTAEL
jgi:hypothetical protein